MEVSYIHDGLSSNRTNLNLDVDNTQGLCANVDLNKAGIYRPVELSKAGYEANGAW